MKPYVPTVVILGVLGMFLAVGLWLGLLCVTVWACTSLLGEGLGILAAMVALVLMHVYGYWFVEDRWGPL